MDDVPVSTGSGITSVAPLFQSSNTSPLRRFQLLESDSEDDHPSKRSRDSCRVTETNDSSSKRKEPGSLPCTGDLLKDFPPVGVTKTQTPAQRRFQLLDSDSEDDHPSTRSRDLSGVTNTSDPSSKRKEPGNMPTRSPLRRLQLLDSDSEDDCPSTRRDLSRVTKTNNSCSKVQPSVANKPKRKEPRDLWKDFSPAAVSKIQTPALDDVCQDYFSSIKKSTSSTAQKQSSAVASSSNSGLFQQNEHFLDSSNPTPPSHRFFLHSDPRIQNLARKRLPNFFPLGILNDRENRREECLIDYMCVIFLFPFLFSYVQSSFSKELTYISQCYCRNQFGSNGSSKTGVSSSKRCRGGQTKSKVSNSKARSAVPKDAGKRRVSANTGSAGHWFTSAEGRKVCFSFHN